MGGDYSTSTGGEYSKSTLKVKSKMATNRIKMQLKKKENALNLAKKNIALLISRGKMQSARIKVEGIIREENTMKVMEWLEMMCDLIHQRVNLITKERRPPEDLLETMCSILYCAKRIEVPELMGICKQLGLKYGKKWIKRNVENRSGMVARNIETALSSKPPTMEKAQKKLIQIAAENDVEMPETEEQISLQIVKHEDEKKVETDPIMVSRMVEILSDPKTFDVSDDQKMDMMRKWGCNQAEAAAALYIAMEKYRNGTFRVNQPSVQPLAAAEGGSGSDQARESVNLFTEFPLSANPDLNTEILPHGSLPDNKTPSRDGPAADSVTAPFGSFPIDANASIPPGETGFSKSYDSAIVAPRSNSGNDVAAGETEEGGEPYDDLEARLAALRRD